MTDKRKTIVVIDDSRTFVMYTGLLLKRLGFDVIPAEQSREGLRLIQVFRPHAVLLDRYLPELDGIELLRQLKADPNLAEIPVIMVSASDKQQTRAECFAAGCAGYLCKPLTPRSLHESLLGQLASDEVLLRRHLRYAYHQQVTLRHEGMVSEHSAVSLSEGGIYLRDQKPLPTGTQVEVLLQLEGGHRLKLPGEVIYQKDVFQNAFRMDPGMAIAFDPLEAVPAAVLQGYISGLLAGDLVAEQSEEVIALDAGPLRPLAGNDRA